MRPLIEAVPNFSDGRNQETIDTIVEHMARAGGVHILDVSSDHDHNRTVVTLVGLPEEVQKSLFAGIEIASERIDLTQHEGVHPRMGATDVVPLIPIRDVSMADCVDIAHQLGQQVADRLNIPIYFYGEAALRQDYQELSAIRTPSFQYEQLREKIQLDPNWVPDIGQPELGTAGATLISARQPLIAYNAYLNTDNVDVAKLIARAIRFSGGGLRYVKASGFLVNGQAQVSMNLTDYRHTPVHRVLDLLRHEANHYGVRITHTELIGLMPQAALNASAVWHWQLHDFNPNMILEHRIQQAESQKGQLGEEEPPVPEGASVKVVLPELNETRRPEQFAIAVAQASATPGGGAVAAQVGALIAALTEMVAGLTIGRRGYQEQDTKMTAIRSSAYELREKLLDAVAQDSDAIDHLMAEVRRAKSDNLTEEPDIQTATLQVADVPLTVARASYDLLLLLEQVGEYGNHNATIDVAMAAHLALAVLEGSVLNIKVNILGLTDEQLTKRYHDECEHLLDIARPLTHKILEITQKRVGIN